MSYKKYFQDIKNEFANIISTSELMQDRLRNYRNCTKGKYMLVKYKIMLHCRDFLIKVDDNLGNMEVLSGLKGI